MSAGAGGSGAGFYGAGQNPPIGSELAGSTSSSMSLFLDLSVMDFPLDANGRYVECHPVDHRALMLIGPDNPLWKELPISDDDEMTRRATEIVNQRWQKLLSNGDITDVQVRAHANDNGRAIIHVSFFNLRDPATKKDRNYTVNL